MSYIPLILIFLAFVALGFSMRHKYLMRRNFYGSLLAFCNHLELEIGFSKKTVSEIITSYASSYNKHLATTLLAFQSLLDAKHDITRQNLSHAIWTGLRGEEVDRVLDFLTELGRLGSHEEREKIRASRQIFSNFHACAQDALRRDASIYFKICILVGIAVVILLL
jgi:stage III sporulation protein AB